MTSEISSKLIAAAKNCVIRLKSGKLSYLGDVISSEQEDILRVLHTHDRVVIPKARQLGVSTICRIYQILYALGHHGSNCAVLSNKYAGTQEISRIDDLLLTHIAKKLGRELVKSKNTRETVLTNGSRILRFSGSASNDRGYTLDHLHISEFAYLPDGTDILATMLASISPDRGQVVIESTPYYYGDPLHQVTTYADTEDGVWHVLFQPWYTFKGYRLDASDIQVLTPEETNLIQQGLELEQIAWRRRRINELSGDLPKFRREYPSTLGEAYDMSDEAYLSTEQIAKIKTANYRLDSRNGVNIAKYAGYDTRYAGSYCIGYDPAGGTGGDYAVAVVLNRVTRDVVCVAWSNNTSIKDFSVLVSQLATEYGKARVMFELNNHGHAVKEVYDNLHHNNYQTYQTNVKSKILLYETLRSCIHSETLGIVDANTIKELRTLVRSSRDLAPSAPQGQHDDRAMALALAIYCDTQMGTPNKSPIFTPTVKHVDIGIPRRLK